MLEEYRVADPCRSRFDDVHVETLVVLHGSAYVVPYLAVNIPGTSVFWFDVRHHRTS